MGPGSTRRWLACSEHKARAETPPRSRSPLSERKSARVRTSQDMEAATQLGWCPFFGFKFFLPSRVEERKRETRERDEEEKVKCFCLSKRGKGGDNFLSLFSRARRESESITEISLTRPHAALLLSFFFCFLSFFFLKIKKKNKSGSMNVIK